jgi:REP element-mobilizing transposase RayT
MLYDLPNRKSPRLKTHDYSTPKLYFVTACAAGRHPLFGDIRNGTLAATAMGDAVGFAWTRLPARFSSIRLDAFVVMPNHVHAILELVSDEVALGTVVGHFKADATKRARKLLCDPEAVLWQDSFHDHIIRDSGELERIREYIRENPGNWIEDEYHPTKL